MIWPVLAMLAAAPSCSAHQLTAHVRQTSGAAGTLAASISFRNDSAVPCSLRGFPALRLARRRAAVQHGGLAILNQPVRTVIVRPGRYASLLITYPSVRYCAKGSLLTVSPPGLSVRVTACGTVTFRESPFLAGLRNV